MTLERYQSFQETMVVRHSTCINERLSKSFSNDSSCTSQTLEEM